MDRSYIYIKKFIDEEVKKLNRPLELSDNIGNLLALQDQDDEDSQPLTESQFMKVLAKMNTKIRRHNKAYFSAQRKNQIIQQIIKAEQNKLLIVNERMMKIKVILKPILIPSYDDVSHEEDNMKELEELVNELPESKYLFAEEEIEESESSSEDSEEDVGVLVEDTEDRIEKPLSKGKRRKQFKKDIINKLNLIAVNNESRLSMLEKYEALRLNLIRLTHDLRYRFEKLDYLDGIKNDLCWSLGKRINNVELDGGVYDSDEEEPHLIGENESGSNDTKLQDEMAKFNSLISQISKKLYENNDNDVMSIISDINNV